MVGLAYRYHRSDQPASCINAAWRDIFDPGFDRQFYRFTLVGDVPVDVDGKPSTALEGQPVTAV